MAPAEGKIIGAPRRTNYTIENLRNKGMHSDKRIYDIFLIYNIMIWYTVHCY